MEHFGGRFCRGTRFWLQNARAPAPRGFERPLFPSVLRSLVFCGFRSERVAMRGFGSGPICLGPEISPPPRRNRPRLPSEIEQGRPLPGRCASKVRTTRSFIPDRGVRMFHPQRFLCPLGPRRKQPLGSLVSACCRHALFRTRVGSWTFPDSPYR